MPQQNNIFIDSYCKTCKKELISKGNGYFVCPSCKNVFQDTMSKMREFVYEYPNSSAIDVAEQFALSHDYVKECFDAGKLNLDTIKNTMKSCQRCKKPIFFDRYCTECRQNLASDLKCEFRGRY